MYIEVLPKCFSHASKIEADTIEEYIKILIQPPLTSFAITTNNGVWLWLSEASFLKIKSSKLIIDSTL